MTDSPLKDVHTEHCCLTHGCKYGRDVTCTVVQGYLAQSYPCEVCDFEAEQRTNYLASATDADIITEMHRRGLLRQVGWRNDQGNYCNGHEHHHRLDGIVGCVPVYINPLDTPTKKG